MEPSSPRHLVLAGGGHAHVEVLRRLARKPLPNARVTLISPDASTPYSGMIPGYLAGHHTFAEAHLDVQRLARAANADFVEARITGLDLARRQVLCAGHAPISFDLLSLNTGSTPRLRDVPGAAEHALPVKPIASFVAGWERVVERLPRATSQPFRVAVVGGGAGGLELTLALQYRSQQNSGARNQSSPVMEFSIVTESPEIVPSHNFRTRKKFARILAARGVATRLRHRAVAVEPGRLRCDPGGMIEADCFIWATNAAAPEWIYESGLQTDAGGFVTVSDTLQSVSHPFVFAAGDVATALNHPRPKAGVFAVRQGPPLAENLGRVWLGEPPRPFVPQREFLSIISTGNQYAVASRGNWAVEGAWVWRLKDWIDRRWMRRYQ
ncbi:MAG TPA: FAD-dependent oxidoreductase [Verrucomicrobiae bacterium]|nr:FAD-dependent oxidoreductase [Verrucomicrobiae bacterium]